MTDEQKEALHFALSVLEQIHSSNALLHRRCRALRALLSASKPAVVLDDERAAQVKEWIEETCADYCIPRPFSHLEWLARAASPQPSSSRVTK
jgi:hypothetical protein